MASRKKTQPADAPADTAQANTDLVAMTPLQRAQMVLGVERVKTELAALAGRFVNIKAITNDDGLAEAKAAVKSLVTARTTIEKAGKSARDDATKFSKAVIAEEKGLIGIIKPEEERIAQLVSIEETRRVEAERVAREQEQARAAVIEQAFAGIRNMRTQPAGVTVEQFTALIADAEAFRDNPPEAIPDDLLHAAKYEANVTINTLKAGRDARAQADADAEELERLRKDQEELAQLRREKAEREAAAAAPNLTQQTLAIRAEIEGRPDPEPEDDDLPPGFGDAEDEDTPPGLDTLEQDTVEQDLPPAFYGTGPVADYRRATQPVRQQPSLAEAANAALGLLKREGLQDTSEFRDLEFALDQLPY